MISCDIDHIMSMARNPVRNYVVPGLTSYIIGAHAESCGVVRMLVSTREQAQEVIPHSHRYDFRAVVLRGSITNRIWKESPEGDEYAQSRLIRKGDHGCYESWFESDIRRWERHDKTYRSGEWYGMIHDEIHSIVFAKDTTLLIFEGPNVRDHSTILEPFVDGSRVPTFRVEPWMFQRP